MNMKRMRGRNNRPNGGGGGTGGGFRNQQNGIPLNRNHVFDSSGPEQRIRGTAQQLYEKYQQMARDSQSNGDRVTGEAYYQHAEHYFRIIAAINQAQGQPPAPQAGQQNGQQPAQGNYQPSQNGQDRDYQRRDYNGDQPEAQAEVRSEPRQDYRQQEPRYQDQPRQQDNRQQDNRQQDNRQQEPRPQEPRRFEQRPYEPRPPKPDYVRQDRPRNQQNYRPEQPVADAPIDISSALEAELAAATGGFEEQPVIQHMQPAVEARAIPIISDAPPPVTEEPAKTAKPRGRPRAPKPAEE